MTTNSFEKNNWDWQFSLLQQQVGEWLEEKVSGFNSDLPEWTVGDSIAPWLGKLLNLLFWLVLVLFLVWVAWRLWQKYSPDLSSMLAGVLASRGSQAKITETELPAGVWVGRSQEFYRQANYREACRCLYFAMLQYLHSQAILPDKSSRTDGEYLQLLRMSVTPMQPYETLMTTHEQICFGNIDISQENYQQCQQAYQEIVQQ